MLACLWLVMSASRLLLLSLPAADSPWFAELQKALDVHNSLRAKHGASPLVWSTQLATQAQNWAKGCSHSHSIVSGSLVVRTTHG